MADRPFLITLIGILTLLVGLVLLLVGAVLVVAPDSDFADAGISIGALDALGFGTLIIGLFALIVAIAFLKGWTIAWYLGILLHGIDLILSLLMFPAGIVTLLISALIIYYLFRPHVKDFFGV
jgi:hypothetical protein